MHNLYSISQSFFIQHTNVFQVITNNIIIFCLSIHVPTPMSVSWSHGSHVTVLLVALHLLVVCYLRFVSLDLFLQVLYLVLMMVYLLSMMLRLHLLHFSICSCSCLLKYWSSSAFSRFPMDPPASLDWKRDRSVLAEGCTHLIAPLRSPCYRKEARER